MTRSKARQRKKQPPAVRVQIARTPRRITPALPQAVPRVRQKRGKR